MLLEPGGQAGVAGRVGPGRRVLVVACLPRSGGSAAYACVST